MTIKQYEQGVLDTSKYETTKDEQLAGVLGLAAEAGEVAGKIEKIIRKDGTYWATSKSEILDVVDELGDALYFLTLTALSLGYSLEDIMRRNNTKLADREERGVIIGFGEKR